MGLEPTNLLTASPFPVVKSDEGLLKFAQADCGFSPGSMARAGAEIGLDLLSYVDKLVDMRSDNPVREAHISLFRFARWKLPICPNRCPGQWL
jgi:hypothetical protein